MAQSQPVMSVGALCFGLSVGFIAYRTLIRTASKAEISDIATVVAAVGGGAVTGLFQPNTDLFGWYAIGLLVGMALFFVLYLIMNGRQKLAKVMSGETVGAAPSAGTSRGPHL